MPYFYVWSSGESSSSANFLAQGTNWVQITDVHHCITSDTFQNTKQLPLSVTEIISTPTCFGFSDGSIYLDITNGYPNYSINWFAGNTPDALNLSDGDYDYTVTDAQGCDYNSTVTLTEPDSILYFKFTADATCAAYDGYADITVNGGSGIISIQWDDSDNNFTRFDLNAGVHIFTLTDDNGCYQDGEVNVGEYTPPLDDNIITTDVTCYGNADGTATITVNDVNTPITFVWDNGATGSTVTNLFYGYRTVQITDNIGCNYYETIFIDEPNPLQVFDIQTGSASCLASDGYAYVDISGGTQPYTVNWSDGGTGISRNNLSAGNYSFTVSDFNNCEVIGFVSVAQLNPMQVSVYKVNVSCYGDNDGYANASVVNALTPVVYQWSAGSQLSYQNNLSAGNYFVTVTDNRGDEDCCFRPIGLA